MHTTKTALFDVLKAAFDTTGTQVAYADPGKLARAQAVWFGDTVEPDIEPVALAPGRRKPSRVTAEVTLRLVATTVSGDPQRAEAAVYALMGTAADAVAEFDPRTVPGLIDVRPIRSSVAHGETGDGATAALADLVLRVRAHALI
ncbi:hypothetical protein JOD54_000834 [Actinokineospora baliensis]|uniref:hypothetical protein n=1 Tax=Actinokineospora baliensis TaxID=547056 RepID=UPI0019586FC8|nr:hypothetical protein [Actinokineospora baliensis]MBM7770630.1 hypothetical protein [Actinokineospora baliensis]